MHVSTRARHARFGPFEVDLKNRELRREGIRLHLQRQPFAVLDALLETPGDLVSRDALRHRLWPDGTFVEFDKGLNTAVMKLREALGEDPQAPRFVETVAGEGYRFVAPVELIGLPHEPTNGAAEAAALPLSTDDLSDPSAVVAAPSPTPAAPGRAMRWTSAAWLAAAIALGSVAAAALLLRTDERASSPRMLRFTLREPPDATFSTRGGFMALSPDGSALAFIASSADGIDRLFIHPLDSLTAQKVEDTEHADPPFWSPDGRSLAFFAEGRLKRLDLASGSLRILDTISPSGVGGTWSERGELVYSSLRAGASADHHGLRLASAAGGPSSDLPIPTGLDAGAYLWWPRFLPDGRSYLFLALGNADRNGIHVASLDGGAAERISPVISSAEYADGRLFYVDDGVLMAQPFDPMRRRLAGDPVPLADGVLVNPRTGRAVFSVTAANGGILTYRQPSRSRLEWFDREGRSLGVVGEPAVYRSFAVSPDGERVAAAVHDPRAGTEDIWILDSQGGSRRLTVGTASEVSPQWSPEGDRIAYASDGDGRWQILIQSVREGSEPDLVAESAGSIAPTAWDETALHVGRFSPGLEVKQIADSVRLLAEPTVGIIDAVSPDRRWLAQARDDTTSRVMTKALFVDAVAPRRGSWHVAPRAGAPSWRADAGELYYLGEDRQLMAVRVGRGDTLELGPPVALFTAAGIEPSGSQGMTYDAAPDGQRFLVKLPAEPSEIVVLANWKSALD